MSILVSHDAAVTTAIVTAARPEVPPDAPAPRPVRPDP
jgi:hypothetical protein